MVKTAAVIIRAGDSAESNNGSAAVACDPVAGKRNTLEKAQVLRTSRVNKTVQDSLLPLLVLLPSSDPLLSLKTSKGFWGSDVSSPSGICGEPQPT